MNFGGAVKSSPQEDRPMAEVAANLESSEHDNKSLQLVLNAILVGS